MGQEVLFAHDAQHALWTGPNALMAQPGPDLAIALAMEWAALQQGTDAARQIARIERGLDAPVLRVQTLEAVRDFVDVRDAVRGPFCDDVIPLAIDLAGSASMRRAWLV